MGYADDEADGDFLLGRLACLEGPSGLRNIDDHWCKVLACDRLCFCG